MESSVTKVQMGLLKSARARDMTIEESLSLPNFCLHKTDDKISLKKSHAYYFQVQGQLMITGVTFCDFLVYTQKEIYIERMTSLCRFYERTWIKFK